MAVLPKNEVAFLEIAYVFRPIELRRDSVPRADWFKVTVHRLFVPDRPCHRKASLANLN